MINLKTPFKNILKLIIGISLLTWLLSRIDLQGIFELMRQGDLFHMITGTALLLFSFSFLQAARLHWSIRSMTKSYLRSARLFFIGFLFNNLLPTNIGGDAVRLYYLQHYREESWGMSAALLFVYRISGLLVLLIGGLVYLFFYFSVLESAMTTYFVVDFNSSLIAGVLLLVLVLVAGLVVLNKKQYSKLKEIFLHGISSFGIINKKEYAVILGLAACFHLGRIAGFYFLILYLGSFVDPVHLIFVLAFTAFISLIPISFGALGLMEGAITGSLLLFGVSPEAAAGVALVNRIVLIFIAGIGAFFYLYPTANK